jgi:hypothetical protein
MPVSIFSPHSATAPSGPAPPHCQGFTITLRHNKFGRTALDELSARLREHYLTTHNTHKRQTTMPWAGFEPRPTPYTARPLGSVIYITGERKFTSFSPIEAGASECVAGKARKAWVYWTFRYQLHIVCLKVKYSALDYVFRQPGIWSSYSSSCPLRWNFSHPNTVLHKFISPSYKLQGVRNIILDGSQQGQAIYTFPVTPRLSLAPK